MQRLAILIGHNDASSLRNGPLLGATRDMVDLRAFLLSEHGGAWEDDEVLWYAAPALHELRSVLLLAKRSYDYVLVAFSGHGAYSQGSFVAVNNDEAIFVDELAQLGPCARRMLVISDACRVRVEMQFALPSKIGSGDVAGLPDISYRQTCRRAYFEALARTNEGAIIMHACATGETAGDTHQGGLFTQSLLRSASQWAASESDGYRARKILYAQGAFNRVDLTARNRMRHGTQTPQLSPRNPPKFPFAIA